MINLGDKVTYIRQDKEKNEPVEGEGTVRALFISPEKRIMAQVKDGDEIYNVDFATLNHDEFFLEAYKEVLAKVKEVTKEGNEKVQDIVKEYNAKVDALYADILGETIED